MASSTPVGERGLSPANSSRGDPVAPERVEVDDRERLAAEVGAVGEGRRAEVAPRATVGRREHDRVGHRQRREIACELDQRCGPGRVVVEALGQAQVVAVGEHEDRLGGALRPDPQRPREEVRQRHGPEAGDRAGERLALDAEVVGGELLLDPAGGRASAGAAGGAVGVRLRERAREPLRHGLVERGRQGGPGQWRRPPDRERRDDQRNGDESPGGAVDPPAYRPLDRAATGPAPPVGSRAWRGGDHSGRAIVVAMVPRLRSSGRP